MVSEPSPAFPSLAYFLDIGNILGIDEDTARKCYLFYARTGWRTKNGEVILPFEYDRILLSWKGRTDGWGPR